MNIDLHGNKKKFIFTYHDNTIVIHNDVVACQKIGLRDEEYHLTMENGDFAVVKDDWRGLVVKDAGIAKLAAIDPTKKESWLDAGWDKPKAGLYPVMVKDATCANGLLSTIADYNGNTWGVWKDGNRSVVEIAVYLPIDVGYLNTKEVRKYYGNGE